LFNSFFPSPKKFFLSGVVWFFASLAMWYGLFDGMAEQFSLMREPLATVEGRRPPFLNPEKIWVYQYIVLTTILFCVAWFFIERTRWYWWAVCGSALILLVTYFQVQLGVYINNWYGDFYDLIQLALSERGVSNVTSEEFYGRLLTLLYILVPNILVLVLFQYFTQHYVFRWRTAMNEYYMQHWARLRTIEGAAQRVQEDTMRFATIMENLGVSMVDAIMTLFAFLPVLWGLSQYVTELPFVGQISAPLFSAAVFWSLFGTILLAVVGIKLPGLEFKNQRVEAAYRKELVYGEDDDNRAQPITLRELFGNVRKNYFRLYFHYMYFNVARSMYLQADNIFAYLILVPTIAAGKITFGLLQQILTAFSQVSNSFQYLVNSWPTIVELLSVHKRLKAFEATLDDKV